jgi:capsular exopolysaccharide synthesis family protein
VDSYFNPPDANNRDPNTEQASANVVAANKKPKVKPWLVNRYLNFLKVEPIKNTRLVEIQFSTPTGRLSQQLANAHADGFVQMNLENRYELTSEARQFLNSKNAEIRRKLERAEEALNRFRQTHGVVSMEKGENIVLDRLVDINRELTAASARRLEAESVYTMIENKSTYHLTQVMTHGLIPTLRSNLQALEAEKVKLSSVLKPDHPRMEEQNTRISEARRALDAEIAHVVRSIQQDYMAARAREQALETEADKQRSSALHLKHLGVQYAVLENEVTVNRALYERILKRLGETSVSNDVTLSNIQVVQSADAPHYPSEPNLPLNLLLASGFGLFLGAGLAFFREYMDSSVSTPEDVWRTASLNTLGVVPDVTSFKYLLNGNGGLVKDLIRTAQNMRKRRAGQSSSKELIVSHHPLSFISESYRIIQNTLLFSQAEGPPRVVLVTSPDSQEGKTVTTLNLAIALAQDGHSVLVVDGDLRRGCCHHRLGLKNHNGLTHVLTGKYSLEECVQTTHIGGLSLVSPGVVPPHPSRLLGSNKMKEVLTSLRNSYEFVLIDSPPVVAVSDAAVLSAMADGVLLVLRGGKTKAAAARLATQRLQACRAWVIGVVLNGVDLRDPDYVHHRNYYYAQENVMSNGTTSNGREGHIVDIALDSVAENGGSGLVGRSVEFMSQDLFNSIRNSLTDAVGPMALILLRERIADLGETEEAFPKTRLRELLELVSQDISDEKVKTRFVEMSALDTRRSTAN